MTVIISGDNGVSDVDGSAGTPAIRGTDANTGIFFPAADTIAFSEGGAEAMRIDSSGNLGLGVTPSAWSIGTALQVKRASFYTYNNDSVEIVQNGAVISGAWQRIGADFATKYSQETGNHIWSTAASSTAGSAITWTECARITSGGYFKAADNGTYVNSTGSYHEFNQSANGINLLITSTNASLANDVIQSQTSRSANSAYTFFAGYSGLSDKEFNLRGDGNGYADGTWNNNGADYAEYFESANGQALTLGATVVLDGNKVREATDQDPASSVIGVVRPKEPSKASMVVGNTAWNKWANKYLTDDFDRYIMEDHDVVEWEETITDEAGNTSTKQHSYESQAIPAGVIVPEDATRKTHDENGVKFQHYKLNPAWNPDSEYVNRENRPEWNIIGLLGQVKILKGQPVGDRWIKMRDVSETVEEWMIR